MPILGTVASSYKSGVTPTFVEIATVTLTSTASSISFTSISSTYTDLVIKISSRTTRNAANDGYSVRFNGGAAGLGRLIYGDGTFAAASTGPNIIDASATTGTNTFSSADIYIPNYAQTANKSFYGHSCTERQETIAYQWLNSLFTTSTSAITSIEIYPDVGPNFTTGASYTLYGIAKTTT